MQFSPSPSPRASEHALLSSHLPRESIRSWLILFGPTKPVPDGQRNFGMRKEINLVETKHDATRRLRSNEFACRQQDSVAETRCNLLHLGQLGVDSSNRSGSRLLSRQATSAYWMLGNVGGISKKKVVNRTIQPAGDVLTEPHHLGCHKLFSRPQGATRLTRLVLRPIPIMGVGHAHSMVVRIVDVLDGLAILPKKTPPDELTELIQLLQRAVRISRMRQLGAGQMSNPGKFAALFYFTHNRHSVY